VEAVVPRKRSIVMASVAAGFMLVATMVTSVALAASGLQTTFKTDSSSGDGYQATFTIVNGTDAAVASWTVAVILPVGAQISNVVGAQLVIAGQQVTATSPNGQGQLAPGASVSFGFTVHGGTAPPFPCVSNGVQCTPANPPSPSPSPTTPATTTPPATTEPPAPAPTTTPPPPPPTTTTPPAPTPTPTPTPAPTTTP
jgi:hypothetical protein